MKHPASSNIASLPGIDNRLLSWMLLFVPLCFMAKWLCCDPLLVFAVSGLAIVPLAAMIANAIENIAGVVGAGLGGLLNATFRVLLTPASWCGSCGRSRGRRQGGCT